MSILPPFSAVGNCHIQLFGPTVGVAGNWDQAVWDGPSEWSGAGWFDITPQSMNVQVSWGTDDNMGALSATSAGSWQVWTYDPERLLDPANYNSPVFNILKPGCPVRILFKDATTEEVVRQGYLDEVSYDVYDRRGSIRATDGISLMVKAKAPAGLAHQPDTPSTLRNFAKFILKAAKVEYIVVGAKPQNEIDPPVGLPINDEVSAWAQISTAALDALHAVWLDRNGILRFRYYGKPTDAGFNIGSDGISLETIDTVLSMESVFNHARARYYSLDEVFHEADNDASVAEYGDLLIARDRPIPNSAEWVDQILQDRGAGAVRYNLGTLRPRTKAELLQLLRLEAVQSIGLHLNGYGTPIGREVISLGASIEANTESGWSAKVITYEPASPWWNKDADRLYQKRITVSESLEFTYVYPSTYTSKYGPEDQELMGSPSGDPKFVHTEKTIALGFPAIDFAEEGMKTIWDAKLRLYIPEHEDTQAENQPRLNHLEILQIAQILGTWNLGSTTPPMTSSVNKAWTAVGEQGKWMEVDARPILNAWFTGAVQSGIYVTPSPYAPQNEILHALIKGQRSQYKPYLLISFKVA